MTDRVYPSSKPGSAPAAPAPPGAAKPPAPARVPYRQPHHRRYRRHRRSYCCCFCFWFVLVLLLLALVAAIAGSALYVLYRPHSPTFEVTSLRVGRLNLTTTPDAATSHLSALMNLTVSSHNPNRHINFFYEPFTVYALAGDTALANGTIAAFASFNQNTTALRPLLSGSLDLDADSARPLRADLRKRNGATLKIRMDTNVRVKVGGFKSRKVGIKVTCQGIKVTPPKGRLASLANVKKSDCTVDLRIKIWRWTY